MTDDDLVSAAAAELYASDPAEFIQRRGALAAAARAAGQAAAAKRIAGLRKPTRSAWIVNQLVRSDPDVSSQLAELGGQLRAAQSSLDGAALRELSLRRRQLIDALARQAFTVAGQHAPAAAIRDEVTATLGAALADPQVAEAVRAGALERAAHSDGFVTAGAQVLTLVPPPSGGSRAPATTGRAAARARNGTTAGLARSGLAATAGKSGASAPGRPAPKTTDLAAARAKAERERRRDAITEAEREVAEADWVLDAAAQAEREQERAVQRLEEQLADARHRLADVRAEARQARIAQRHARQALDRWRK